MAPDICENYSDSLEQHNIEYLHFVKNIESSQGQMHYPNTQTLLLAVQLVRLFFDFSIINSL